MELQSSRSQRSEDTLTLLQRIHQTYRRFRDFRRGHSTASPSSLPADIFVWLGIVFAVPGVEDLQTLVRQLT